MTAKRRYRLLCPIARALDAVGDRWALLILRDLHAGPARFLLVDGDSFTVVSNTDRVDVLYADTSIEPDRIIRTNYQGFLDAAEGRIPLDEFASQHLEIIDGEAHLDSFFALMAGAMTNRE